MVELYELITKFTKTYPEIFWIGTILILGFLTFLTINPILKRRNKSSDEIWGNKTNKEYIDHIIKIIGEKQEIEQKQKHTVHPQIFESKTTTHTNVTKTKEPKIIYKSNLEQVKKSNEIYTVKPKTKQKEKLPEAIEEVNKELEEHLFVNYELNFPENLDNYPVIRIPKKGCIVRSHRFGNTKKRGFKEESFQESIQKYFENHFIISGEVRLNTGKDTRPFEPDIAIIEMKKEQNIRIDIEIDEPYAGITRQPTHCKGEDFMRDTYFVDRGWLVIRFSEFQVHTQEIECLKYIAFIINSIDSNYSIPTELDSVLNLKSEKLWDVVQAQKWEKVYHREQYLNHTFAVVPEKSETVERDLNKQEINEEKLVKPTNIGIVDNKQNIGYNQKNIHERDSRIKFYPKPHIYTIDSVPAPSASTIISKFFPEFDSPFWSREKAIKKLTIEGQQLTESNIDRVANEIAKEWKENGERAAQKGTHLHEQIEKYYLGQNYNETEEFHLFEKFVNEHSLIKPYRTEWRIFDEGFNIAGTIDLISMNGNGFEIYDWKRSKKVINKETGEPITDNPWQSGVGALSDIPDTSYNKFCLQQSLYRYILENNYDLDVSRMYLIVMHPDYKSYYKVETPYWKDRIEFILKTL